VPSPSPATVRSAPRAPRRAAPSSPPALPELPGDPREAARAAHLRYVNVDGPGIRRRRAGRGFSYTGTDGQPLRDPETLAWIRSLAIPPAWSDVWISPLRYGHVLATGRDAKGRKQYRYHPRWREVRDETKYTRAISFAHALPAIRAKAEDDLGRPGLPREKVLATVVRLLEKTLIRVGNEEYARSNRSYGLTTMRDKHVEVDGSTLRFEFKGKSGKQYSVDLRDRRLARIVKRCQDLPGQTLFQYLDESGDRQTIDSGDVNDYLREITGEDYTAKDFRTWAGTVLAHQALLALEEVDSEAGAKRNVVRAIESVAEHLGNTPAVCRKSYVHPAVIEAYVEGSLGDEDDRSDAAPRGVDRQMLDTVRQRAQEEIAGSLTALRPEEAAALALLERRLARLAEASESGAGAARSA
jgi:DNA topoisomerase I